MKHISLFLGLFLFLIAGFFYWQVVSKTPVKSLTVSPVKITPTVGVKKIDVPQVSIIARNLEVPWAIAFLPDGRMLLTERPGRVRIISVAGDVSSPIATFNVFQKPDTEGGLLGIVLSPNFSSNHFVYIYYTYFGKGDNTLNRVARMTFANDKLQDEKIIVDSIPGALYHDGGRIKFGPDNYLYITTGDSESPSLAQNKNSLAGKILRVTEEGAPAPGNPFHNLVYSYGHRNPQGIAWDKNGNLWETEHGRSNPTGFDEVNLIESGKNYGWPIIQGSESRPGMVAAVLNSGPTTTWAPSGAAFVGNSFFFSGLKGQTLYEAVIVNNQVVSLKKHFENHFGRLREVILGPDKMLYVTTSNRDGRGTSQNDDDKIIRINPQKLEQK